MKTIVFLVIATFSLQFKGFSQSEKFPQKMKQTLTMMDSAKSTADLLEVSAQFERIGDVEKTQWLPYYYAALCLINSGWMDANADKDQIAEKTKPIIAKAEAIEKNAELYVLDYMVATQQMLVDPRSRWMTYSSIMDQALTNAKSSDPANPRIYYLEGNGVFGKPEAFGGGKQKAKVLLQKSVDLFKTFTPASPFHPTWGKREAEGMLAKCSS
ncbi:hypothetical protein BH09BAC2_BH09BAC2_18020 [soil metagenome]